MIMSSIQTNRLETRFIFQHYESVIKVHANVKIVGNIKKIPLVRNAFRK